MSYRGFRLALVLCLLSLINVSQAQQFPPLWTLNRTCAADPIPTPEGFDFPGAIISVVPDDGVRALRAATRQTYYVAFAGSNFIEGGALSPDGKWYAVPYGYIQTAATSDFRYIVQELRVISTGTVPQIVARMAWQATFQVGKLQPIRWLDNETLIFAQGSFLQEQTPQVVKPFSEEAQPGDLGDYAYLSPDLTRGFKLIGDSWSLIDVATAKTLTRFPALTDQLILFRWSPDSSRFAAIKEQADSRTLQFYGREGNLTANVAALTQERLPWNFAWSPDGTKFVFSAYDPYKNENTLHLGDIQTQTVTDTCILLVNRHEGKHDSGVLWSPDGNQLLMVTSARFDDRSAQQIMDVATGIRYSLGVYTGGLIGWSVE